MIAWFCDSMVLWTLGSHAWAGLIRKVSFHVSLPPPLHHHTKLPNICSSRQKAAMTKWHRKWRLIVPEKVLGLMKPSKWSQGTMSHATKRWKISTETSLPVWFRDYNIQTDLVIWVRKQAAQIVPYKLTTGENSVFQGHQSNLTSSGQYSASWEKVNVFSPLITISEAKSGDHRD